MGLLKSNLREEHNIKDAGRMFPADYEYVRTGTAEGWLVYVHGFRDYRGVMVHTYQVVSEDTS